MIEMLLATAIGFDISCTIDLDAPHHPPQVGDVVLATCTVTDFCPDHPDFTFLVTPDGVTHELEFDCGDFPTIVAVPVPFLVTEPGVHEWFFSAYDVPIWNGCTTGWATVVPNPQETTCGDVNADGEINITDLLFVINQWGTGGPFGDTNSDGIVDIWDLINVICNWAGAESGCYP